WSRSLPRCSCAIDPSAREDLSVPRALHDAAAVARMLGREVLGIAAADDALGRIAAEREGRKCHRAEQGFEPTRGQGQDEAPAAALEAGHQLIAIASRCQLC